MKMYLVILMGLCLTSVATATETDEHVFSDEESDRFYHSFFNREIGPFFQFPQTTWDECNEAITGNYFDARCRTNRGISVILKSFINNHIYRCIDAGLLAQEGQGRVAQLHIVHDGILADAEHSPKSLHAESRAIDVVTFHLRLSTGARRSYVYEDTANRPFYRAFRSCWGEVVHKHNGCPYYNGKPGLTGSIGWEHSKHRQHMHVSVPYCVNGAYGPYYYRR